MAMRRAVQLAVLAAGVLSLAGVAAALRAPAAGPDDEDVLPGKEPKLPLEEPRQEVVRDKAVQWLKDHATNAAVPDDVAKGIDETLSKTNTFRFAIGADLNDTGKAYLVECWYNRLYSFALSEEQAKAIDLKPLSLLQYSALTKQDAGRLEKPLLRLEDLHFVREEDAATTKDQDWVVNEAKITGQVTLKTSTAPAGKYTLRLSYRRGTALCQAYNELDELPKAGETISFSFSPISDKDDKDKFTGPLPLYVDLCKIVKVKADVYETTIYSNTLSKLVDAEPLRAVAPGR